MKTMINYFPLGVLGVVASVIFVIFCATYETPPRPGDVYCDYDMGETWSAPGESRPFVMMRKVKAVKDKKVLVERFTVFEDMETHHVEEEWIPETLLINGTAKKIKEAKQIPPCRGRQG